MTDKYTELEAALVGLLYRSESDEPLDFICWEKPAGKTLDCNFVCEQLGQEPETKVEEGDAQAFLEDCSKIETWFGDDERKVAQGFQELRELLNQLFKSLRLFRVGEIEVTVVLVADDESGSIVGFKTTSVET